MVRKSDSLVVPIFMVLVSMFSLTTGAALAKHLFIVVGAAPTTVLRLGIGAAFLLILWRPWRHAISRKKLQPILLYGGCLGLMNLLFYFAIERMPLGLAIAVEFIGPLGVAIYFSRRSIDFLWAGLAVLGIILILPLNGVQTSVSLSGVAFALGAAAMWAAYILIGKKAGQSAASGVVTAIGMTFAFVLVIPFGISGVGPVFSSQTLILIALGVGLLSSAIPYSLEMVALKKIPSQTFGLLMSLEPAIGALAGFLFIGELLTPLQMIAVFCVVAASVGSALTRRRDDQVPMPVPAAS